MHDVVGSAKETMKRIVAAGVLGICLGLPGCSLELKSGPTTTTVNKLTGEQQYLSSLRDWSVDQPFNIIDAGTDDDLLGLGHVACDALDAGNTPDDLAQVIAVTLINADGDTPVNTEAAGRLVGYAVAFLCPEHGDKF